MRASLYFLIILNMLAFWGCGDDKNNSEETFLYLNHHKSECGSFALKLCMQSKKNEDDEWSMFYDHIEGFAYEWGYRYKLKVKVEKIENPPEDGSSNIYTLLAVEEKTKVSIDLFFDLSVSRASGLIVKSTNENYIIYDDVEVRCQIATCKVLDSLNDQDKAILFEISHQADPTDPLMIVQIKCSASREMFQELCL